MSTSSGSGRRRGRPKKGLEFDADTILDAAIACFAEHGFDKASLRMIADRAGVDVALISYRYGSKLGLWTAVVDAVASEGLARVASWTDDHAGLQPDQKIRYLCKDLIKMIEKRPLFAHILTSELMLNGDNERKDMIAQRIARPVSQKVSAYVRTIKNCSREEPGPRFEMSLLLAISSIGFAISTRDFLSKVSPRPRSSEELSSDLEELIIRMLG